MYNLKKKDTQKWKWKTYDSLTFLMDLASVFVGIDRARCHSGHFEGFSII